MYFLKRLQWAYGDGGTPLKVAVGMIPVGDSRVPDRGDVAKLPVMGRKMID